jgi:predicted Zn-dependent protease
VARGLVALGLLGLLGSGLYFATVHLIAWSHYRAAQEALARRDFAQARMHLADCLKVWPNSSRAHFLAARAARQAGDLDAAEEELGSCQRLGDLADDTTVEWALLLAQRGKLTEVEEFLRKRLHEGHPDSVLILETLSQELMWTHRYIDARQLLDLWLRHRPEELEALVRRGWVAEHLFDYPAAISDYTQALTIDPGKDNIRLRLAEILLQQNRAKDALAHLQQLRERQPGNSAVAVSLARCRRRLGQVDEARQLLDQLLTERPRDLEALSERGALALEVGQPADAESWLRTALSQDPHNRQVNYSLCQCLQRLGKHDEAQTYLAKLRQIDDELKRMGQVVGEVMKRPHDPALRCEAGVIFLRNGKPEDGLHWLITALQEDPRHRPTHQALAEYYERIGNKEQAARHRQFLDKPDTAAQMPLPFDRKGIIP